MAKKLKKREMIRGVPVKKYLGYMRRIESGQTTDENLVKAGKLKRTKRGISPNKRASAQIFSNRNKTKGKGKPGECRVPTCHKTSARRGLCNTHRVEARRMIKLKKTTETNLINRSLLLPKASGGNRVSRKKGRGRKKVGKLRPRKSSGVKFPKKLLESTTCLFKGCTTTRRGGSRGLCGKHYSQYKRKKKKLSDKKKKQLDRDLIKRRLLLPPKPKTSKLQRKKKRKGHPESSAFEIGSTMRGSIRRY